MVRIDYELATLGSGNRGRNAYMELLGQELATALGAVALAAALVSAVAG